MMQRRAMVIRVKPEKLAEYKALHADPFPGVLAALKAANVANYSIFLKDDVLFGYLEYTGTNWDADMAQVAADPETQRWWTFTAKARGGAAHGSATTNGKDISWVDWQASARS